MGAHSVVIVRIVLNFLSPSIPGPMPVDRCEDAMSLFSRGPRGDEVQRGDIFRKAGTYGGDWVVEQVFDYPDIPRHVRMIERNSRRAMTVAAALLSDPAFFTRQSPRPS
jgi:hypothetical protein